MALKDWKKIDDTKRVATWKNMKVKHLYLEIIYQYAYVPQEKDYSVVLFKGVDAPSKVLERFKTKAQALKFAKDYMKKH